MTIILRKRKNAKETIIVRQWEYVVSHNAKKILFGCKNKTL